MANRAGTGRNNSKKNIKNSVILNSEETMRKMDIFGDTLFGKEKEEEKTTEPMNYANNENESAIEKIEEIVPIQEEKIDDLDFEITDFSEPQSTLTEGESKIEEIAQNSDGIMTPEEVNPIEEEIVEVKNMENVVNPSIEEVAMDDILSMIDEENEEEIETEEPIGTADLSDAIEQNSEQIDNDIITESAPIEEVNNSKSNLTDFSSEILGNSQESDTSIVEPVATEEEKNTTLEETSQGGMKIEDLLIGNTLLEMMQNADVDVSAIERTEGREALKMIGEE